MVVPACLPPPVHGSEPFVLPVACRTGLRTTLAILLLWLAALAPAAAVDWTYRTRPGDNLWTLSQRYLRADIGWQRLGHHNGITDPKTVPPGRILRFPVAWLRAQPAPARLVAMRGPVQVEGRDGTQAARVGMALGMGSMLSTGVDASATITFADGSQMQLREHTRVRFDRLRRYGDTGMVDTTVRQEGGRTLNQVTPARGPASRFVIDTPNGSSSVRGTLFRVAAGAARGHGATEVLQGQVAVRSGPGQALVPPGQAALQQAGLAPRPRPLPAPPAIDDGASHLDGAPFRLVWAAVAEADGYRIEAVDADHPLELRLAGTTATTDYTIPSLPPGHYRLRVRAIGADGIEGLDAERLLDIPDLPPPLTMTPAADEPINSARPRFAWTRPAAAAAVQLQIARNPDFTDLVGQLSSRGTRARAPTALPPGRYFWRVASRTEAGLQGMFSQAVGFDVVDEPVDPGLQPASDGRHLILRWRAGKPGQRYRVQLARKPDFAKPRLDQVVEQPELVTRRPWAGTWYVRVQTLDDDGYAGEFSEPQQIPLGCRPCYWLGGGAALLWWVL